MVKGDVVTLRWESACYDAPVATPTQQRDLSYMYLNAAEICPFIYTHAVLCSVNVSVGRSQICELTFSWKSLLGG